MSRRQLPLLAVDLSDVLEDTWPDKRSWITDETGRDPGPLPLPRTVLICEFGGRSADFRRRMNETVYSNEAILARLPVEGALVGVERLRECWRIVVVTARREGKRATTEAWLADRGFLELVDGLILLGHDAATEGAEEKRRKLAWCADNGCRVLLDNSPRHLEAKSVREAAIERFLLLRGAIAPEPIPTGVKLVSSWKQATNVLVSLLSQLRD